jgi:putative endonuclease
VCYVYFLALSNGDTYVGSTNDLKRRFRSHELGKVPSTQPFLPVKLRCYISVETEQNARKLEQYFKSGSAHNPGSAAPVPTTFSQVPR